MALHPLLAAPVELDYVLTDYVQYMFEEGEAKGHAATTASAVQDKWPHLKGNLRGTWRATKAWEHLEPGAFRTPWPVELVFLLWLFLVFYKETFCTQRKSSPLGGALCALVNAAI